MVLLPGPVAVGGVKGAILTPDHGEQLLQETFDLDPSTAAVPKRPPTLSIAEAERLEREQERKRQRQQ